MPQAPVHVPAYDVTVRAAAPARSASESLRDRAALNTAPHRTADELLALVPGMFVTQHGGEGKAFQLFYRGFDAVHGQDVEVWAGGIPVNEVSNIHGQGYADLHFLPVELVQQVRALPGSFDPKQGDFAVAGSLHLKLGYDEPGITTKAASGSFGMRRLFLGYRPETADASNFVGVELYHTDGFGPARAADRGSAVAQTTWQATDSVRARLFASAHAGRFESAGVVRLRDLQTEDFNRFSTYDPNQGGSGTRLQTLFELSGDEPGLRSSLAVYGIRRGLRLRQNFTGFATDARGDGQEQINDAHTLGAYGALRKRVAWLSPLDAVEAGFFARADWIDQAQRQVAQLDGRVIKRSVDARVMATNVAAYLDVALRPLPRLSLRGGVRADALSYGIRDRDADGEMVAARDAHGLHLGKKLTADVRLWKSGNLLLSYGEGFRSPQARSLVQGQTTPFATTRGFEAGVRTTSTWGAASLAAFATRLSDDLVFDQTTARNEAVPGTQRWGATTDVTWRFLRECQASAGATYTRAHFHKSDARVSKGELLPYVPQLVSRLDLLWVHSWATFANHALVSEVGSGWSLLARRPLPYGEMGEDVFLVDAAVRLRWGPLGAALEIFNLADQGWFDGQFVYAGNWDTNTAPSLVPERYVTVGAPRTVWATAMVFF